MRIYFVFIKFFCEFFARNGVSKIAFHSATNNYSYGTRKHSPYTLDLKILLKWLKGIEL